MRVLSSMTSIGTLCLSMTGCGVTGPLQNLLNTPAERVDCTYTRVQLHYTLTCELEGTVRSLEAGQRIR